MALGIFKGNQVYDRAKLLANAADARKRGKRKRAIELYRKVLEVEPGNLDLHRRVAPLLAETKHESEALDSYRRVGDGLAQGGLYEQAVGLYREAASYYPQKIELWETLARLQLKRSRRKDAVRCLIEGRGNFRSRKQRPEVQVWVCERRVQRDRPRVGLDGLVGTARAVQRKAEVESVARIGGVQSNCPLK